MKSFLSVLLLSVCACAQGIGGNAGMGGKVGMGGGFVSGVVTDSCTGGLLFSWHAETTNVTTGGVAGVVNNGCSVGATIPTTSGSPSIDATQFEDGTHSALFPTVADYYIFTPVANDIIGTSAGTMDFWVRVSSFVDGTAVMYAPSSAASNGIYILMTPVSTINQFKVDYQSGGNDAQSFTTFGSSFSLNTWYHIIAKWDQATAHSAAYVQICADTTTGTTNCGTYGAQPPAFSGSYTALRIGNGLGGGTGTFNVDVFKVYSTWQ